MQEYVSYVIFLATESKVDPATWTGRARVGGVHFLIDDVIIINKYKGEYFQNLHVRIIFFRPLR